MHRDRGAMHLHSQGKNPKFLMEGRIGFLEVDVSFYTENLDN